ncbi:MAG: hypothetical protein FWE53_00405 [Firmicutes bacterium]|nr:hypothetical protein [Bacillota bacterium]
MKKLFVILACFVFSVSVFAFALYPNMKSERVTAGNWNDGIDINTYVFTGGGSGDSALDPYIITDASDLAYMSKQAAENASILNYKFYELANDILNLDVHYFTPIGSGNENNKIYNISFNGNGYTLDGLTIDIGSDYNGLFGFLADSDIYNLNLTGVSIVDTASGGMYTGAVAGYAQGSTFTDINTSGTITVTNNYAGGMVGALGGAESGFVGCISNVNVTSTTGSYTGGIFGAAYSGTVTLSGCRNYGNISGNEYVAGIGSGYSTTSATFILDSCVNTGVVKSLTFNESYFAGLIAYASSSLNNVMNFCSNTGKIDATNSNYVAGLVAFGKFSIKDCFNNAGVDGRNFVAGIAAYGTFDVDGSYNGVSGNISASGSSADTVAGGIVGRMAGPGSIKLSYNKGAVSVSGNGTPAGLLGSFDAAGAPANMFVIENCYNWGEAGNAFIGASSQSVTVVNCYNMSGSSVAAGANIINSLIVNGGSAGSIFNNLSAYSPSGWGLDTQQSFFNGTTYVNYNNGLPYIRSGLVSALYIDLQGGEATGAFKGFYLQDYLGQTQVLFTDFKKLGYSFVGFNVPMPFVHKLQAEVLYCQYALTDYAIEVDVDAGSVSEGTVGLYKWVGGTLTLTADPEDFYANLETNMVIKAEQISQLSNKFAYWAVEFDAVLYQVSNQAELNLGSIFNMSFLAAFEEHLLALPAGAADFRFVAVFEESWEIEVDIATQHKNWGDLTITVGGNTHGFNFDNTFRVPVTHTAINLTLTPKEYYKTSSFSIEKVNDASGQTLIEPYTLNEFEPTSINIQLKSDLKLSISFAVTIYNFSISSVYEDFTDTPDNLIELYGNVYPFYIDQFINPAVQSGISAKAGDIEAYRFLGFKFKYAIGGGYSNYVDLYAPGVMGAVDVDAGFLKDYFVSGAQYYNGGTVYIVAVYKQQYQLNVEFNDHELGSLDVRINTSSILDYNGRYFDEGSDIKIFIIIYDNCRLDSITINAAAAAQVDLPLETGLNILIRLAKIRYYLELYTIDYDNIKIDTEGNLEAIDFKSDLFGEYLEYDDNFVIYNYQSLEMRNNMMFVAWYYRLAGGALVPITADEDDNINSIITKGIINQVKWTGSGGREYITIVAKIVNIFVLDVHLSITQSLRGDYIVAVYDEGLNDFVIVDKDDTEFAMGATVRITAVSNNYFSFAYFEDSQGNKLAADSSNPFALTFVLSGNQFISVYFDPDDFYFALGPGDISPNGEVMYLINSKAAEIGQMQTVKIGDTIIVSFEPGANYQVSEFTINGKTLIQLRDDYGAQIAGNSLIIRVNADFLDWISGNQGLISANISTAISTLYIILLASIAVLVPGMVLAATIIMVYNQRKKAAALVVKARQAKTKGGHDFRDMMDKIGEEKRKEINK